MPEVTMEDAPRKARDMFEKGFAAMERGNLDYAMDMFTASLEIEPSLLQARRFLRAAQIKKYKAKKSGPVFHAISTVIGLSTYLTARGQLKKDPAKAVKAGEKLLRIDPANKLFINLFADAAVAAGLPEAAVQTLEVAKDLYAKDIALLKRLGSLYMELNETHKGRECFESIVNLRPNDPEAIKAFKDATALDTMHSGGWSSAGSYRDVMKDAQEATRLEQQAKAVKTSSDVDDLINETLSKIRNEPDNINYRRHLADLYTRAQRYDEALEVLKEAQEQSGGGDPQIDRSLSSVQLKKFDSEIETLKKEDRTEEAEARKKEKEEFQMEDAADRVKRYPNDLQFKYDYGVLLFERGRINDAIQQFQQAQRNPQRRTRALYYLGLCFKQKEQYDIALEQLEKAASEIGVMDAVKKDIYYELGTICESTGDRSKAAKYFKEIYSVDIGYKDVAEKIEKSYK